MDDKIEKIRKVTSKEAVTKILDPQEELQRLSPNKERFDNFMQPSNSTPEKIEISRKIEPSTKTSLIDEVRDLNTKNNKPTRLTPVELVAETEQAINQIDDIKTKMSAANTSLKESAVPILKNKITHIDESIRIALSHTGSEFSDTAVTPVSAPKENPIARFLGLLTDGQSKLQSLSGDLQIMAGTKAQEINPAQLLLIQIKVGYIQQELEFFSGLLNKGLESTKTIMNVQV